MKLIGKQIVVELPKNYDTWFPGNGNPDDRKWLKEGFNRALSEVAKMNSALEVDEQKIAEIIWNESRHGKESYDLTWQEVNHPTSGISPEFINVAHALASDPLAWMKRKE